MRPTETIDSGSRLWWIVLIAVHLLASAAPPSSFTLTGLDNEGRDREEEERWGGGGRVLS